jgi:glycosyltransferase involved in cell wall biosynthesis
MSERRVLLTVSGNVPDDLDEAVAAGRRPRADYAAMAHAFGADLVDYRRARAEGGPIARSIGRLIGDEIVLAWHCYRVRTRYDVIVTDGEQIGLPLAALCRLTARRASSGAAHAMIVHIMSTPSKRRLFGWLRLGTYVDEMITYSSAQRRFAIDALGMRSDQVTLTPFMVDTQFFRDRTSTARSADGNPVVAAAGLECRDYPTLVQAAVGLDATVIIAAASPWSKRESELDDMELPNNVRVVRLDLSELRDLYANSDIVVLPLQDVPFQAGVTTLLEAMSMGKPVVCTRTTGQTDIVIDGVTGVYVPPSDVDAMRTAIRRLLADADARAAIGAAAAAWARAHADLDVYVATLQQRVASIEARAH